MSRADNVRLSGDRIKRRLPRMALSGCAGSAIAAAAFGGKAATAELLPKLLKGSHLSIVLNEHFEEDGATVYRAACQLGCEGTVSKRLGSPYRSGRSPHWVKVKNPKAPAVKREAEEDWK